MKAASRNITALHSSVNTEHEQEGRGMLRREQSDSSFGRHEGLMSASLKAAECPEGFGIREDNRGEVFGPPESLIAGAAEPDDDGGGQDAPLDDAAQSEREYVRGRLREELKREPTEDELDEWLRQHTEGY
jgi:hypothetical protein